MASKNQQKLKSIPSVNAILERNDIKALMTEWSFAYVSYETKNQTALARKRAQNTGKVESADEIAAKIIKAFIDKKTTLIKPVINATGVALHTNLGRAPLDDGLLQTVMANCSSYCNLEFDLVEGKRSKRGSLAGEIAAVLTGTEAGIIVNNNAAAVLLTVSRFGRDKEILISRGELVQIGGGFRIPEIITASGAILKEIGTTNKTVLSDYSKHIGKNTGLIMKVHKSNFDIRGFTEETPPSELALLAHKKRLPMLYDLGSGMVDDFGISEFKAEPSVVSAVSSKADIVCFSGDKLFGGPQAGILVGKKKYISALRRYPFYRPLRPDKFTLSAIEQTLLAYLTNPERVKLNKIFKQDIDSLKNRAEKISSTIELDYVMPSPLKSTAGGGTTPNISYKSYGISIIKNTAGLDVRLRNYAPPIIIRKGKDKAMLDLSTVFPAQDEIIIKALKECLS
ncbi:MAG: L-seryl-tRNA(Sec) selenium transferase [candidate division Zixibacteria bacterium]|nr:L-seryl-tRNA(Sec) selenium transferase [candidate division Zixibacteria bacterium]